MNPVAETKSATKKRNAALVFIFITVVVDVLAWRVTNQQRGST